MHHDYSDAVHSDSVRPHQTHADVIRIMHSNGLKARLFQSTVGTQDVIQWLDQTATICARVPANAPDTLIIEADATVEFTGRGIVIRLLNGRTWYN